MHSIVLITGLLIGFFPSLIVAYFLRANPPRLTVVMRGFSLGALAFIIGYLQSIESYLSLLPTFFFGFSFPALFTVFQIFFHTKSRDKIGLPKLGRLPSIALATEGPSFTTPTETSKSFKSKRLYKAKVFFSNHAEDIVALFLAAVCLAIGSVALKSWDVAFEGTAPFMFAYLSTNISRRTR